MACSKSRVGAGQPARCLTAFHPARCCTRPAAAVGSGAPDTNPACARSGRGASITAAMAPSWSLRAAQGLAGTLPQPAGLLLGAVDEGARTITLLGAVPAPAAGGAKDVAAAAGALRMPPVAPARGGARRRRGRGVWARTARPRSGTAARPPAGVPRLTPRPPTLLRPCHSCTLPPSQSARPGAVRGARGRQLRLPRAAARRARAARRPRRGRAARRRLHARRRAGGRGGAGGAARRARAAWPLGDKVRHRAAWRRARECAGSRFAAEGTLAVPGRPPPPRLHLARPAAADCRAGPCRRRAHVDLLLRVAAGPGGPTEQALAHAFVEAAQQLAGPQLVYVSEPK